MNNSPLHTLIQTTENAEHWEYEKALQLRQTYIHEAPYDMIVDNPDDVLNGVNRVQVVLNDRFFDLFNSLLIKHHTDGSIMLVFNDTITDGTKIMQFYDRLVLLLGHGYNDDERNRSFAERDKVMSLSQGIFNDDEDLVGTAWTRPGYGFSLSYRTEPLRQLVFSLTWSPAQLKDVQPRKNGTLINILTHDLNIIIHGQELSALPKYENGQIKFTDYTYHLEPPELKIFDRVRIRIFGQEKTLTNDQYHVTYYSRFEINTPDAIELCDRLIKIYGTDTHNSKEIEPYEIRMIDERVSWTGRSWWINGAHGIKNFDDSEDAVLYWVNLVQTPDEDGFNLHVTDFNNMMEYHLRHKKEF